MLIEFLISPEREEPFGAGEKLEAALPSDLAAHLPLLDDLFLRDHRENRPLPDYIPKTETTSTIREAYLVQLVVSLIGLAGDVVVSVCPEIYISRRLLFSDRLCRCSTFDHSCRRGQIFTIFLGIFWFSGFLDFWFIFFFFIEFLFKRIQLPFYFLISFLKTGIIG